MVRTYASRRSAVVRTLGVTDRPEQLVRRQPGSFQEGVRTSPKGVSRSASMFSKIVSQTSSFQRLFPHGSCSPRRTRLSGEPRSSREPPAWRAGQKGQRPRATSRASVRVGAVLQFREVGLEVVGFVASRAFLLGFASELSTQLEKSRGTWETSPQCLGRIARHNLAETRRLRGPFSRR